MIDERDEDPFVAEERDEDSLMTETLSESKF
jgi:hypothetical protein